MAALAPASPQRSCAHTAMLCTQPFVQVDQFRGLISDDQGPAVCRLAGLLGELGHGHIAPGGHCLSVRGDGCPLGPGLLQPGLNRFKALHDVKLDVLQVGLPAQQGLDLGLQVPQLPR